MKISFKEFCGLSKEEQKHLGSNLNEDLSGNLKKKKMVELEKLLKKHDFLYDYMDGDYREWKRQHEMAQDIRKLRELIGADAEQLYKQYAKKGGCWEGNTSPTPGKVKEVKERHSLFPEMDKTERKGNLGYTDGTVLPNGGHHFADSPFDTMTKWQAPSKKKYV